MPRKPANGAYTVVGASKVERVVRIEIEDKAWDDCDLDLQKGVIRILDKQPIHLLTGTGKSNGIKQELNGLEFHTQTKNRLQAPFCGIDQDLFRFTTCAKGWGH
jgi:hypothetical protein